MSDADSPPAPYNDGEAQQMAAVLRTAIASRSTTFDAMSGHVVSKGMQAVESRMTMLTASVAFLAIFGLAGAIYTVRDSGVAARAPAAGLISLCCPIATTDSLSPSFHSCHARCPRLADANASSLLLLDAPLQSEREYCAGLTGADQCPPVDAGLHSTIRALVTVTTLVAGEELALLVLLFP